MNADNFSLDRYLRRIRYGGSCSADIESVDNLMQHQLRSIPFENLDVRAGKPVDIDPEHIADKILNGNRGGYCFELNGLFAMMLDALGIDYRFVAARPMLYAERRPCTHVAIAVELHGKKWLCDLGFGSYGMRRPLCFDEVDREQQQGHERFRLQTVGNGFFRLQALVEGAWRNQYEFDLSPRDWIDFVPVNYYTSTHPDSLFVNNLVVLRFTPEGRKILFNEQLKIIARGLVETQQVSVNDLSAVLEKEFGLVD